MRDLRPEAITFYIDVEGATLSIDGDTVDYSAPVVLTYGVHELHAEADGYDDFDKKLFVNSLCGKYRHLLPVKALRQIMT